MSLSTIMIISKLIHSPYGRVLKAMRDDPISCTSLGKNITFLKISVFTISASMMSIAGLILASYISYIDPTIFNLDESIYILSVLIIGGSGNIKGPIVGAIFMVLFPELLRLIGLPDSIAANLRMISYGVLLILTMNYFPQGIAGEFKFRG
ncbi:MAG: branched-chain amino acid ABC transporter permease [Nanoarchaeota archaeon]|nr:branched-chain amino acid ABC transporter permease [Nanoarchaeota archaeon]